jgi:hypothetical protein
VYIYVWVGQIKHVLTKQTQAVLRALVYGLLRRMHVLRPLLLCIQSHLIQTQYQCPPTQQQVLDHHQPMGQFSPEEEQVAVVWVKRLSSAPFVAALRPVGWWLILQCSLVDVIAGNDHKGRDAHCGATGQACSLQCSGAEAEDLNLAADA